MSASLMHAPRSASPLSLHHLTALDLTVTELIELASMLDCSHVGLFTHLPASARTRFPVVDSIEAERAVTDALRATGISVNNIEIFALRPGVTADDYLRSLERGGQLGAAQATVHLHDLQGSQAVDLFAEFCQQVSGFGMNAALEFTSFSSVRTFEQAAQIVTSARMDNACMAVDALHFFRNGGQVDDISRWSAVPIGYVQLCDASLEAPDDLYAEAVSNRMPPGEGEFPLSSLLASLPRDVMLDVEVPQHVLRDQGVSAFSRAVAVVGATRDLLEKSGR